MMYDVNYLLILMVYHPKMDDIKERKKWKKLLKIRRCHLI
jgi:hypothetical protein